MKIVLDKVIQDLIKECPNDADLGIRIRKLYYESMEINKSKKNVIQQENIKKG